MTGGKQFGVAEISTILEMSTLVLIINDFQSFLVLDQEIPRTENTGAKCCEVSVAEFVEHRKNNLQFIAYNTRYLIMPWVKIPHLASHLLATISRRISNDWMKVYSHPIYFLETFIDPDLYKGTCYRAANWVSMGLTTGRGKNNQDKKANRSLKEVLGYSLNKKFRKLLTQ